MFLKNVEIRMPRICNRQINKVNIDSENAEKYFKRSIFLPFLDYLIKSVDTRFDNSKPLLLIILTVKI